MHRQKIAVFTTAKDVFEAIQRALPAGVGDIRLFSKPGEVVPTDLSLAVVDCNWPAGPRSVCQELAKGAVYTILVEEEDQVGGEVPELLAEGIVDDLLLLPLRAIELLSKVNHATHLTRVRELDEVNAGLKSLIEKLEEDLKTTRSIQRSLIPEKFPEVHGLSVVHKYLSGMKSGGDYLDFFEFNDKNHVGLLMSDSSGYGLSSAFMSVILHLAMKLTKDQARSPSATVMKIFEELSMTMKPKENLSIFLGILNRKTFELVYTSAGNIRFFHQNGQFYDRSSASEPLWKDKPVTVKDNHVLLQPGDRIVLFSDGFAEGFENDKAITETCERASGQDAIEIINDFTFQIKKKLTEEDDMPNQDCSVMIVDVEKRAMRLAK
jgi:sigma-B regulation protein RsbU (phosphoserine phosphatase)